MPDLAKLRVFTNTYLGEAWTDQGNAPSADRVMLRREAYTPELLHYLEDGSHEWIEATLPEGRYVLTLGADVQHDRIECELVAWSRGKTSHSLGYHVFIGETADPGDRSWDMLTECIMRQHADMGVVLALIDSGDQASVVYSVIDARFSGGVWPSKGASSTMGKGALFRTKPLMGHLCQLVSLDEIALKDEFYAMTKLGPVDAPAPGQALPPGYCHFPTEINERYDRRYFSQLYSEDVVYKQTQTGRAHYYDARNRRNEALDCRILALGALYVAAADVASVDEDDPGAIDWAYYWDLVDPR